MGKKKASKNKEFDKYWYYENTVQCVENDIEFVNKEYQRIFNKKAHILREDFGGTGQLACEWTAQSPKHSAMAIDLDPEPIEYGKKHHYSKLSKKDQGRMDYILQDVLKADKIKAEIIVAFNFSYFIFKQRKQLLKYFKNVHKSLKKDGVFFLDLFGGTEAQDLTEEETEYDNYSYYWDCDKFDPITNECLFHIHFKPKGEKKRREVFTYDWRLWSLPELRDILEEAGFSKTIAYWEEDDEDDDGGNGVFYPTESEENCDSWVTYIAAVK